MADKIKNFARIRAKLRLRFLISSNSFYFGSLIFSYVPLPTLDEVTLSRTYTSPVSSDFVEILQRPLVMMDPTTALDREMVLPFFYPYEYYPLTAESNDIGSIGRIVWNDLNKLRHANGASDPVVISVWAWMEDVDLLVPTTYTSTMELSRDTDLGPAAKVCSAVHAASSKMSEIPFLAPYTTPIQAASKMGYEFAKEHGLSRPENTQAIHRVKATIMSEMAQVDRADVSEALCLDSANTLSIDPHSVNLDDDDMDILKLSKRFSYMFSNTIAVVSTDAIIASIRVRPSVAVVNSTEYHYPIVSYLSLPFSFWRGTLKYKFQFVASAYHKGRFRITWDPYPSASNMVNSNYFNTTYTQVLDLEGDRELIFEVPYAHFKPFLRNFRSSADYSTTSILTPGEQDNGILSVMCLTPLVSPNTTSFQPIYMNVYVAAGDDYMLCNPEDIKTDGLTFFSTSATDFVQPLDDTDNSTNKILTTIPHPAALTANGECIMNIRALTKRVAFCYYKSVSAPTSATTTMNFFYINDYDRPLFPGNMATGAWLNTGATTPTNLCTHNFITHFEPCFAGRKGGYKVRYVPFFLTSSSLTVIAGDYYPITVSKASKSPITTLESGMTQIATYTSGSDYKRDYNMIYGCGGGSGALNLPAISPGQLKHRIDPCPDVSLPYYGDRKFLLSRVINNPSLTVQSGYYAWGNANTVTCAHPGQATTGSFGFNKFVSTRDDYSLFFFVSTPVVYYKAPITPV